MIEIDALKYELEQQKKSFNKLHKMYVSLLKQQGELEKENEQLKQYKQSVRDILLSWSQKNLSAKQLQIVIAIMEELNVMGDVE